MNEKVKAEYFPWLFGRDNPNTKPLYKIVARVMSLTGDSIVMVHKAGSLYVENHYIRDIVNNEAIANGMDKKEYELLKWVVQSEITDPLADVKKKTGE